jgi:hypothetical protein
MVQCASCARGDPPCPDIRKQSLIPSCSTDPPRSETLRLGLLSVPCDRRDDRTRKRIIWLVDTATESMIGQWKNCRGRLLSMIRAVLGVGR